MARLEADVQSNAAARCYVQKCNPYLERIPSLKTFVSEYTRAIITRPSYVELDGEITAVNSNESNSRMVEIAMSVAPPTLALLHAAVSKTSDDANFSGKKLYLETLQVAAQPYPDRYNRALKEATKEQKKDDRERRKMGKSLEKSRKKAELQHLRHPLPANYPEMMTLSENAVKAHNNERFLVYGNGRPG
ncbi:hypothetical protein NYO67_6679 [Aspergillus flavus]|nr:hypothetical protein NYO67_6679 [Aspergillus flavus]